MLRSSTEVAHVVNIMFTFVSGIVINRTRLEYLRKIDKRIEAPEAFRGTNMVQLSWTLPLLRHHRRSLVLWRRPLASFIGGSGGYSFGAVFGENLTTVLARTLFDRADLNRIITNTTLRRYFPAKIYEIRSGNRDFLLHEANRAFKNCFAANPRFWVFSWPILHLPLRLAAVWMKAGAAISKVLYALHVPRFWRKRD